MTDRLVSPEAKPPVPKRMVTSEEFIATWPLQLLATVDDFNPPDRISLKCDSDCKKETTWAKAYGQTGLSDHSVDDNLKSVGYRCVLCSKGSLTVVYRIMETEERPGRYYSTGFHRSSPPPAPVTVTTKVIEVGQYPSLPIAVSRDLEKGLGKEAADLYRKGLINRNHGYGLGAATYIRRVVEDKTNELIGVAADLAESHNVAPETVTKMRAAASSGEYTTYEDELKIASTVYPDNLKVGDLNPLKTLYGLVSKGIHGLSEEECIEIFDQTVDVFQFIFTNLKAEAEDRQAFIDKVKRLERNKGPLNTTA